MQHWRRLTAVWRTLVADTLSHDSLTAMAEAALDEVEGGSSADWPVNGRLCNDGNGPSRARQGFRDGFVEYKPQSRYARNEANNVPTIKMAAGKRFRGVTRHLLGSFLSAQAMADEALVARVIQMAQDVGSATFVNQQKAIMARRDQTPTLQGFAGKALVLCGLEDTDDATGAVRGHGTPRAGCTAGAVARCRPSVESWGTLSSSPMRS